MANSKANIMQIPLNTELNLNKVDSDVKQFIGFNANNAPFIGGCLSGLFKKDVECDSNAIVDKDGNIISYDPESKYFKKNGQNWIYNSNEDTEVFIRKEAKFWNEYTGAEVPSGEVVAAIPYDDENVYDYVLWNEKEHKLYLCYYYVENDEVFHSFEVKSNVSTLPMLGLYRDGSLLFASSFGVVKGNVLDQDNFTFESFNAAKIGNYYYLGSKDNFYIFDLNGDLEHACRTVFIDNSVSGLPATAFFCFNIVNQKAYLYFYRQFVFTISGVGNRQALAIDVEDISYYQGTSAHIDATKVISTASMTSFAGNPFTDSIRSQVKASLYSSTAEKHFYLGWWDDIKLTENGYNKYGDGFAQMITKRGFSFLYNSDELSGISKNGVLLTEWFSVDSYFPVNVKDNCLIYKDVNTNKIIIISSTSDWTKAQYKTFSNKLFTNLGNGTYLDLDAGKIGRAFIDFNGRLPCCPSSTNEISDAVTGFIATGINQDFANNKEQIISMLINPTTITCKNLSSLNLFVPATDVLLGVDVYIGSSSTPPYYRTISNDVGNIRSFSVVKAEKEGLEWTSDTGGNLIITPSVFSSFISSGLNMDLIKEGKNTYRLLNYNNRQVLGFYLNSLLENVQNVFVIQGNAYAIIDSLIYSYDVQNGVNVGSMPIVDIHDLQFLASTPYKAYFYSPLTQSVLSFNGSNTLNYEFTATKINRIIDSVYNPDTLSIIFTSDKEVIFISRFGMFSIPKQSEENNERIYISKKGVAIVYPAIELVQFLRYTKTTTEDLTEFDKKDIELETCFYGLENQKMSVNDCVYVRLFDEDKRAGVFEISATTISLSTKETDKTVINVKPSDWDKDSKTLFVRYQPKRQRGLGTSFKIKSPFNIVSMAIGNIPDANLIDNMSKGTNIDW